MKIVVGSDHAGFELKEKIIKYLVGKGHEVHDVGTYSPERCDYPEFGEKAARAVLAGAGDLGIVVCGTGVGISIAANKVPGIRCGVCTESTTASLIRRHNDANMLAIGARIVGEEVCYDIVDAFLSAEFEGGRHAERVALISEIESKY